MNILARMDDLSGKERIENALPSFSINLFYARQDQSMLWLAKNAQIDAVVIGIHSEPESVLRSVKALKHGFLHIPYLCFYAGNQNAPVWNNRTLEQACVSFGASDFILADELGDTQLRQSLSSMTTNREVAANAEATLLLTAAGARSELVG